MPLRNAWAKPSSCRLGSLGNDIRELMVISVIISFVQDG